MCEESGKVALGWDYFGINGHPQCLCVKTAKQNTDTTNALEKFFFFLERKETSFFLEALFNTAL